MLASFGIHQAELRSSLRTLAGDFFTEEMEIKDRVATMLFKLKSVFVSAVAAYEHCVTIKHFR